MRHRDSNLLYFGGRLTQQWMVDLAAAIVDYRLNWYRQDQLAEQKKKKVRRRGDQLKNVRQALEEEKLDDSGTALFLTEKMIDSPRHMRNLQRKALAIFRHFGSPDLFITMTMDRKHLDVLAAYETFGMPADADHADLIARVFQLLKNKLLYWLIQEDTFGRVVALAQAIEFQFRGTPHMHLLLWFTADDKPHEAADYDKYSTCRLPPEDQPLLRAWFFSSTCTARVASSIRRRAA